MRMQKVCGSRKPGGVWGSTRCGKGRRDGTPSVYDVRCGKVGGLSNGSGAGKTAWDTVGLAQDIQCVWCGRESWDTGELCDRYFAERGSTGVVVL